jgi:hypothetical protein
VLSLVKHERETKGLGIPIFDLTQFRQKLVIGCIIPPAFESGFPSAYGVDIHMKTYISFYSSFLCKQVKPSLSKLTSYENAGELAPGRRQKTCDKALFGMLE